MKWSVFLWPTLNSLQMFSEGTTLAWHISCLYSGSVGAAVDTAANILLASSSNVANNDGKETASFMHPPKMISSGVRSEE